MKSLLYPKINPILEIHNSKSYLLCAVVRSLFLRLREKTGTHLYGKMRIDTDAVGTRGHSVVALSDTWVTAYGGKHSSGRDLRVNLSWGLADHMYGNCKIMAWTTDWIPGEKTRSALRAQVKADSTPLRPYLRADFYRWAIFPSFIAPFSCAGPSVIIPLL